MNPTYYQPYYCEENIRHLIDHPELCGVSGSVVFITNETRACAVFGMKHAEPGEPVLWDYHCILATVGDEPLIWDPDTRLALPVAAATYIASSFSLTAPERYRPKFLLVPIETYRHRFASDRSHMCDRDGKWLEPPPPWPPFTVGGGPTLHRFLDLNDPIVGTWVDLDGLKSHFYCQDRH